MKAKKETLVSKAEQLLKQNPDMKPIDMAKVLGVKVQRVYVLRNALKKKTAKALHKASTGKKRGRPAKTITITASGASTKDDYEYINGAQVLRSTDVKKLQAEVVKLNDWCIEWRKKYDELKNDLLLVQSAYAESRAVIRYLESKTK